MFPQVGLRFDEMSLERCPGILLIQLGSPGLAVFLEFPCFREETIGDADGLIFCDKIACCGCVINALVHPCVEFFERLVGIVGFPELPVVLVQVRCQHPHIVCVQMA